VTSRVSLRCSAMHDSSSSKRHLDARERGRALLSLPGGRGRPADWPQQRIQTALPRFRQGARSGFICQDTATVSSSNQKGHRGSPSGLHGAPSYHICIFSRPLEAAFRRHVGQELHNMADGGRRRKTPAGKAQPEGWRQNKRDGQWAAPHRRFLSSTAPRQHIRLIMIRPTETARYHLHSTGLHVASTETLPRLDFSLTAHPRRNLTF
jgi:hypothetical protein